MKRLLLVAVATALLTGCLPPDTIIRTDSGSTNVGVVTAEEVAVRVDTNINGETFQLGVHRLGTISPMFSAGWADFLDDMQSKDLTVTLSTVVAYKGTLNSTMKLIDVTTVTCPKGLMFSGCISQIEATEKGIQLLYKEKHSFLK